MDLSTWVRGLGIAIRNFSSSAKRARRFRTAAHAATAASVDVLEARVLLTSDFGDAPDTTADTGVNNYQTLAANGGPSHVIDATRATLFLGGGVDGETGTQQSNAANLDNLFTTGGRNDEDGVMNSLALSATIGASPKVTLSATNTTDAAATLYGWIDYNHNGIFENAGERTQIVVPSGTAAGRFTLTFPRLRGDIAGATYARFRLSSDVAAANPTGPADGGEIEDYRFQIMNRVRTPAEGSTSFRVAADLNGAPTLVPDDGLAYVSSASVGDLDGNGVVDLAVGAAGETYDDSNRGAVYILFRNADGSVGSSVRIASEINGGPTLAVGDHFGFVVTALGDLDGDGIVDIAVGAVDSNYTGPHLYNGSVYILHLNADGTAKDSTKLSSGLNGVSQLAEGNYFVFVTALGDLDGDGITDIAVGAPAVYGAGTQNGAVHILRLNADGTVKNSNVIENSAIWDPTIVNHEYFGFDTTAIGDLDGDGVIDLAVTSFIASPLRGRVAAVNILKLNIDGTLKSATTLVSAEGGDAALCDYHSLVSTAAAGDIDGDGVGDLVISGAKETGRASLSLISLLCLNADGTIKSSTNLPTLDVGSTDNYGIRTNITPIANADGTLSLAIGIPYFGGFSAPHSSLTFLSLASSAPFTVAPAVPVLNGNAASVADPRPTISWSKSSLASEHEIWLKNVSTGEVQLRSVAGTKTSYTPTADLGIGKYSVSVRAGNEIGWSAWSQRFNFVVNSPATIIPTPDGLIRRPELKWQPLAGAVGYDVWLSDSKTPYVALVNKRTNSPQTAFVPDINLPDGSYRFQVRGIAADGTLGKWSIADDFAVKTSSTIRQVSDQFTLRPQVEWTPVPGAAFYDVYISTLPSGSVRIQTQVDATYNISFKPAADLAVGNYRAWVRPVAADGSRGVWSPAVDFSAGVIPALVLNKSEFRFNEQATFQMPELPGAKFMQFWVDDPTPGLLPAPGAGDRYYYMSSFTADFEVQGKYRFWMRVIAQDGSTSRWSAPVSFTVRSAPYYLTVFNQPNMTDRPRIEWPAVAGAAKYQVRIRDVDTSTVQTIESNSPQTLLNLEQSLPLGRYQIDVRAVSADGTEGFWSDARSYESLPSLILVPISPTVNTTPTLQWNSIPGAVSYDVIVRNPTTHRVEYTVRGLASTSCIPSRLALGSHELWVIANGMNGLRSAWATEEFQIIAPPRPVLNIDFPGFQYGVTGYPISWSAVAGTDHYDLWIADRSLRNGVRELNVTSTAYTLNTILPRAVYIVWVRAVYSDGTFSPWSIPGSFEIN